MNFHLFSKLIIYDIEHCGMNKRSSHSELIDTQWLQVLQHDGLVVNVVGDCVPGRTRVAVC